MVAELLYDGYRLLLQRGDGIVDRALDVYSAFQFLPRDTALFRAYESHVKSSVRVARGAPTKWTPLLSEMDFESKSR